MPDGNISDSECEFLCLDLEVDHILTIRTSDVFVSTGIHVYGSGNPMYGQHFEVCEGYNADPRCGGGVLTILYISHPGSRVIDAY